MEDILVDMHRTEGIIQARGGLTNTTAGKAYYANTLAKHGITPQDFDSALIWYTAHPETFIRIYGHVTERLDKEKDRLKEPAEKYPYVSMEWSNPLTKYGYTPYETPYEVIHLIERLERDTAKVPGPVGQRKRRKQI